MDNDLEETTGKLEIGNLFMMSMKSISYSGN